jgi:hypothetical protein
MKTTCTAAKLESISMLSKKGEAKTDAAAAENIPNLVTPETEASMVENATVYKLRIRSLAWMLVKWLSSKMELMGKKDDKAMMAVEPMAVTDLL